LENRCRRVNSPSGREWKPGVNMSYSFELGPIRPPSEAYSILLRVTRNCPWNKCAFCSTYKDQKFSRRSPDEIKKDIDSMRVLADRISAAADRLGTGDTAGDRVLLEARGLDITPYTYYQHVGFWMHHGLKSVFLQDANSLVLATAVLSDILSYIKLKFPAIERITSYARAKTLSKKSVDELKELRTAGLSRIHIGMESGCDRVLEIMNKGVTADEQVIAGRRVMESGFDLSEYYMPGLGGREFGARNASDSARVINLVNPTFIRLRSTVPLPGTPLYELMEENSWTPLTEDEKVMEIRSFIQQLENVTGTLLSDHMMNLLEDIQGTLPDDKQRMLDVIDRYLGMPAEDRESFIVGRRLGFLRLLSEYRHDENLEDIKRQLKARFSTIDQAVLEIARGFL
jgi:radical SAM superfamily enzyme YgiQ (UPF0313 family)